MTITLTKDTLSLEEFLALPETKPAGEYIDGHIYQKPMPQGKHSRLQATLTALINQLFETSFRASAFPELRCQFGGRSIVPDITVFLWDNIPLDQDGEPLNRISIPPDWLIEVLSPNQSPILVIEKLDFAIKHGSKLGWLIAPEERRILSFQNDRFIYHQGMDILPVLEPMANWLVTVDDVFQLLKMK